MTLFEELTVVFGVYVLDSIQEKFIKLLNVQQQGNHAASGVPPNEDNTKYEELDVV